MDKETDSTSSSSGNFFASIGKTISTAFRSVTRRRKEPKPVTNKDAPSNWSTAERNLEEEIYGLESSIEKIYRQVVHGASATDENGDPVNLAVLTVKARELKKVLRAKRVDLSRIKRDAARESLLHQQPATGEKTHHRQIPSPKADNREAKPKVPEFSPSSHFQKVIHRAMETGKFEDEAQQVFFERTIQDFLEPDPEIRKMAASSMVELGGEAAREVLTAALDDPEERVRISALNALALLGQPKSAKLFRHYTKSKDPAARLAALRGLARIDDSTDDTTLIAALEDEHPAVRKAAAVYLGWRQTRQATKALMRTLRDEDEQVRAAAAGALGSIRDDRAVLSLFRILEDHKLSVREKAKEALEHTLEETLDVNIADDPIQIGLWVNQRKIWWKSARVERQFRDVFKESEPSMESTFAPMEPKMAAPIAPPTKQYNKPPIETSVAKETTSPQTQTQTLTSAQRRNVIAEAKASLKNASPTKSTPTADIGDLSNLEGLNNLGAMEPDMPQTTSDAIGDLAGKPDLGADLPSLDQIPVVDAIGDAKPDLGADLPSLDQIPVVDAKPDLGADLPSLGQIPVVDAKPDLGADLPSVGQITVADAKPDLGADLPSLDPIPAIDAIGAVEVPTEKKPQKPEDKPKIKPAEDTPAPVVNLEAGNISLGDDIQPDLGVPEITEATKEDTQSGNLASLAGIDGLADTEMAGIGNISPEHEEGGLADFQPDLGGASPDLGVQTVDPTSGLVDLSNIGENIDATSGGLVNFENLGIGGPESNEDSKDESTTEVENGLSGEDYEDPLKGLGMSNADSEK